ncbi:hypothetical protein C8R45DRAFT_1078577 [Mycena sanguinolenta]|nr:hypothetical protein C8R45DRAFT_1078577 [Mycena sanguinolenta]
MSQVLGDVWAWCVPVERRGWDDSMGSGPGDFVSRPSGSSSGFTSVTAAASMSTSGSSSAISHVFDWSGPSGFEGRERRERGAAGILGPIQSPPIQILQYVPTDADSAFKLGLAPRFQLVSTTTSLAVLLGISAVFRWKIIAIIVFDTVRPVSSHISRTHARVHISFLPRFLSFPDPEAHTRCPDSFYAVEWNGTESRRGAYTQEYLTKFMAGKNARSKFLAIMRNYKQTPSATWRLHLHLRQHPRARAMSLTRRGPLPMLAATILPHFPHLPASSSRFFVPLPVSGFPLLLNFFLPILRFL